MELDILLGMRLQYKGVLAFSVVHRDVGPHQLTTEMVL